MKIQEANISRSSIRFRWLLILTLILLVQTAKASFILIPMDEKQSNHLKAYGITYWTLEQGIEVKWLLNYRGGSFLIQHQQSIASECLVRGREF